MAAAGAYSQVFLQQLQEQARRLGLELSNVVQGAIRYRYPGGEAILHLENLWREYNTVPPEERGGFMFWYMTQEVMRLKEPIFAAFFHQVRVEAARLGAEVTRADQGSMDYEYQGAQGVLYFQEMWRQYTMVPVEERGAFITWWLEQYIAEPREPVPRTYEAVRHRLLPRIVSGEWGRGTMAEKLVPLWPLVEGQLQIALVVDFPGHVGHVTTAELEDWGKPFEELYLEAEANLRRETNAARVERVTGNVAVRSLQTGDSHDAARALLLKDLMRPWPPCGVVFVVPARDVLFFSPVAGHDTLDPLQDMVVNAARIYAEAPRPISDQAFWFDGTAYELIQVDLRPGGAGILPSDRFGWAINGRLVPAYPEG